MLLNRLNLFFPASRLLAFASRSTRSIGIIAPIVMMDRKSSADREQYIVL